MQEVSDWITGNDFRRMIAGAYTAFVREHEGINSLNVFPVPDGDTGTNMMLTLGAVARAVGEASDSGIGALSKRAADSAIMGARGNSGVILAQIFRGIARGLAGKEDASSSVIGKAFQYGILYAYRAVARPVEGTILTVSKGIAKGTQQAVRSGMPFADILGQAISAGEKELARTPELLPALKAAGVVDAGGKGLIVFLQGCLDGLSGMYSSPEAGFDRALITIEYQGELDVTHPYCTEFIVSPCSVKADEVKQQLLELGDSLVVSEGDNIIKVHIHTAHPGMVLESAVIWGALHDIKIDNMADQHKNVIASKKTKARLAVISVAAGEGLAGIMKQLGAAIIVAGGQTMNPSVEDFVDVIHTDIADRYIILPNNKNIVLAAAQVKKLLGERVEIVPTVNIPQGIAALTAFVADDSIDQNIARMKERMAAVKAAGVTVAVRDSMVAAKQVLAGSYIGVIDNNVVVDSEDLYTALVTVVKKLAANDTEIITLYHGADVREQDARLMADKLAGELEGKEVELYFGGQPHYHYFVSIE